MPFTGKHSGYNYWQCFARKNVSIKLEDLGYSSEDFGWKDTTAEISITVWIKPGVIHEYAMRRFFTVHDFLKDFKRWHQLMHKEKQEHQINENSDLMKLLQQTVGDLAFLDNRIFFHAQFNQ